MIAWHGILLLEACLVFLVNDDEAKVLEGQENRGASTEDNVVGMA
jgi:hypothetical protein